MKISTIFSKWFKPKYGAANVTYVPEFKAPYILKVYSNHLDNISNKSKDVVLLIQREISKTEYVHEFKQIDFGNPKDAYKTINFIESAYQAIDENISKVIQEEFVTRLQLIETEKLYADLTMYNLDSEQAEILKEYLAQSQIGYLGQAISNNAIDIVQGNEDKQTILISEHVLQDSLTKIENNKHKISLLKNKNFKENQYSNLKEHYSKSLKKEPDLSKSICKKLQNGLDRTLAIKNGVKEPETIKK